MTDRLNSGEVHKPGKAQCPPDMPTGKSPEDEARRVRYWLDRGNASLRAEGQFDLQWRHANGHYWLESIG